MKKTSMLTVSAISYGYRKYLIALILVTLLILVNLVPASASPVAPDNKPIVTNATEGNQKQKITGVVTDADTKEPLVGVTVLSVTSKGLKRGTVTDNNGKFSLDISDRNAKEY